MKNYFLCVEGWASLWKRMFYKTTNLISHYVLPIIFGELVVDDWAVIPSTRFSGQRAIDNFLKDNARKNNSIIIVTKSYGGYRVLKSLLNHFDKHLRKYNRIMWVSVDPHGGGYGLYKDMKIMPQWKNLTVLNYYQRKKYPKGARIDGAKSNIRPGARDHWEIIYNKKVLAGIKEACFILEGGYV